MSRVLGCKLSETRLGGQVRSCYEVEEVFMGFPAFHLTLVTIFLLSLITLSKCHVLYSVLGLHINKCQR